MTRSKDTVAGNGATKISRERYCWYVPIIGDHPSVWKIANSAQVIGIPA
jgi:hypothetical protein